MFKIKTRLILLWLVACGNGVRDDRPVPPSAPEPVSTAAPTPTPTPNDELEEPTVDPAPAAPDFVEPTAISRPWRCSGEIFTGVGRNRVIIEQPVGTPVATPSYVYAKFLGDELSSRVDILFEQGGHLALDGRAMGSYDAVPFATLALPSFSGMLCGEAKLTIAGKDIVVDLPAPRKLPSCGAGRAIKGQMTYCLSEPLCHGPEIRGTLDGAFIVSDSISWIGAEVLRDYGRLLWRYRDGFLVSGLTPNDLVQSAVFSPGPLKGKMPRYYCAANGEQVTTEDSAQTKLRDFTALGYCADGIPAAAVKVVWKNACQPPLPLP